ncbi:hypothetical protein FQN57_002991 [Myotisia sp. PD_48]|nr:hypothetical protein FQN57_002991 [Myotisia sp. PD_48]
MAVNGQKPLEPEVEIRPVNFEANGQRIVNTMDADERVIRSLGYKQEFNRHFTLWTTFCVSFSVLGLLPSFASTLQYGMGYAGTAGMVWGWVIAMAFIQCIAMSLAELCSSMPTSGGLYYAAAVLAPPGYGPFAAWLTGWSSWVSLITAAPSVNYGISAMTLAAASISYPSYVPKAHHTFLLTSLFMVIHGILASMPTKWIAVFNSYGSTFNILALFFSVIAIPTGATSSPRLNSSTEVWGTVRNGTAYPDGIAVLMSFVSVIWTMSGYDSPFHLTEECSNANIAAPRAIVLTSAIGGIMGWILQLVVAYTVKDIDSVLMSELGQPWASFLLQTVTRRLALTILVLTIVCGFSMGQACMISASRVTYAYSRDGCIPFSRIWKRVNKYTHTPVNAVALNCTLGILCTFLVLPGGVAAGALFSIGGIASFVAFSIPIFIRIAFTGNKFRPGPWNLGKYSTFIGAMGVSFVGLMIPVLCLPSSVGAQLTPKVMNWTCLAYGGSMASVITWWLLDARKWFKGPQVNVEHLMLQHDQ